jgi:hypothetical protein
MEHVSSKPVRGEPGAPGAEIPGYPASGRALEPSPARVLAVFAGVALAVGALFGLARWLAPAIDTPGGLVASIAAGVALTLLAGAIVEWVVHRWIMHRPSRLPVLRLAYEHHHRAHHWINFPPDQYVQAGPVQYVPLWSGRLDRVATSRLAWAVTVAAHFAFYGVFAIACVVLPVWLWSGNAAFAWAATASSAVVLFLFLHAHDAMHYPGLSPLERFGFFRWLDHHHYIHHIDTGANTNFLLPLGDLLLGTLRREPTAAERRRWPSYEEARRRLVTPAFAADGTRLRGTLRPA